MARALGAKGLIAIDESTTIKNHKAKRTKAPNEDSNWVQVQKTLDRLSNYKKSARHLRADRVPEQRSSGVRQFLCISGAVRCYLQRRTMGAHSFQQVLGYRNLEELTHNIDKFSYRVLKKDCLDLPEKIYTARYVSLTDEQRSMYKRLQEHAMLLFEDGEMVSAPCRNHADAAHPTGYVWASEDRRW